MKIKLYPRNPELRRLELESARKPQLQFIRTSELLMRVAAGKSTTRTGSSAGVYQPLDADLTTIAANITAAGHAILDDADAAAQRTTLGAMGLSGNNQTTNGMTIDGGTTAADTMKLRGRDSTLGAWNDILTITAGNPPTADFGVAATIGGQGIYTVGGTDIPVTDGGTGASTAATALVNLGAGPPHTSVIQPCTPKVNNTSTTLGSSDVGVVQYCCKAPKAVAAGGTITLTFIVTQAWVSAGTTPWAEVAILTGAVPTVGNPSLNYIGSVAIPSAGGTGVKTYTITTTNALAAGDDLWIGFGSKATSTRQVFRSVGSDEWGYGIIATKTTMATFSGASYPVTFTADSTANTGAACIVRLV